MGVDDPAGEDGRYLWRLDQVERCVRRGSVLKAWALIENAPDGADRDIDHRLEYLAGARRCRQGTPNTTHCVAVPSNRPGAKRAWLSSWRR